MKTNFRTIAIGAIAGMAAFAALAQGTDTPAPEVSTALKPVKLMTVEAEQTTLTRQFFGKVIARRTVDLAFQVGGQIREFPVIEGARLKAGDLVGELDLRPFELSLEQARLQKEQADRNVDRLLKLKGNTVSQVTIDDSQTTAALAAIKLENAEIALDDATLNAPFDALVASRSVESFTTIAAGTPVVRLHDMSEIRVEIDVPEVLVQRAGMAENVQVTARFPATTEKHPLAVRELTAETSAIGQTYRATFGMEPPENTMVLPGSSVTVTATLAQEGQGIRIPASAIAIDNDGSTHVFLFTPQGAAEGTLRRVQIEVAPTDDGKVRLMSGIEVGDEIVLAGVNVLKDGMTVRRFTGFGN